MGRLSNAVRTMTASAASSAEDGASAIISTLSAIRWVVTATGAGSVARNDSSRVRGSRSSASMRWYARAKVSASCATRTRGAAMIRAESHGTPSVATDG